MRRRAPAPSLRQCAASKTQLCASLLRAAPRPAPGARPARACARHVLAAVRPVRVPLPQGAPRLPRGLEGGARPLGTLKKKSVAARFPARALTRSAPRRAADGAAAAAAGAGPGGQDERAGARQGAARPSRRAARAARAGTAHRRCAPPETLRGRAACRPSTAAARARWSRCVRSESWSEATLTPAHRAAGLNIGRVDAAGAAVVLWDLGGSAPLRSIWDKYFAESHALMCAPKQRFCLRARAAEAPPAQLRGGRGGGGAAGGEPRGAGAGASRLAGVALPLAPRGAHALRLLL